MISIEDQLFEIASIYDNHINRIKSLLDLNYREEAVILTVTIFEVYFRDLFRVTKELWFVQYPCGSVDCLPIKEGIEARKKIQDYLQSIKAYDDFLGNYYVFERCSIGPTKESIFATIFSEDDKMNYLNFQLLNENKGVRSAYQMFFDIDIMKNLDPNVDSSQRKWIKLINLFKDRHEIIHKGKDTDFSKEDIIALLDALDYLKSQVMKKILSPYAGSIN